MIPPDPKAIAAKERLRAASLERQRRIIVADSMQPIDYQFRGGNAMEWTETMRAGVYAARRKLVTYLDYYHWQWAMEHKRLGIALASLDMRFARPLKKVKHKKQQQRLERRKARLRLPIISALAEHSWKPRVGITGDQTDAGHQFMADYQQAMAALAGKSIWIGDRVGGGGGSGLDAGAIMGGKMADTIRATIRARGESCAKVLCAVAGRNESVTAAAREAGLADRKGKAMASLREGLEFLCSWYANEIRLGGSPRRRPASSKPAPAPNIPTTRGRPAA